MECLFRVLANRGCVFSSPYIKQSIDSQVHPEFQIMAGTATRIADVFFFHVLNTPSTGGNIRNFKRWRDGDRFTISRYLKLPIINGIVRRFDPRKFEMNSQTHDYELERRGPVLIWWFRQNFSQSRYGDRTNGSNACTLIALLVALRISQSDIKISGQTPLSPELIKSLGDSFVLGNEIHERLLKSGELPHVNMSVPEAIEAAGKSMRSIVEWKSLVYLMDMGDSLFDQLSETVQEWYRNPPSNHSDNLFVVIIADNRSVLLVFQHSIAKVTLIDSHQHLNRGAVVAQVDLNSLESLCVWYLGLVKHCYNVRPECYELSYLYFRRYEGGEMILC